MAVVALTALVLSGSIEAVKLKQQRDTYLKQAVLHEQKEAFWRKMEQTDIKMAQLRESSLEAQKSMRTTARQEIEALSGARRELSERVDRVLADDLKQKEEFAERYRANVARYHKMATYYAALMRKYRAAASRPWRSIDPDPPAPEP